MRSLLLIGAGGVAVLLLGALLVAGDLAFDGGRLVGAVTGRDRLLAACAPVLEAKLREAGYEPREIDLGAAPTVALAAGAGRTLEGRFTFEDGAAGARVDGMVACVVGRAVTVEFRTSGPPVRAT